MAITAMVIRSGLIAIALNKMTNYESNETLAYIANT